MADPEETGPEVSKVEPADVEAPVVEEFKMSDPVAPVAVAAPRKRSALWPVLGGVIAAVVGYGVAQVVPNGWPIGSSKTLESQLAAEVSQVQALKDQVAALGQKLEAASGLVNRVSKLEAAPAPAAPDLTSLEARVAGLEARPAGSGDPAVLAQLKSDIEVLKASGAGIVSPAVQASLDAKVTETQAKLTAIEEAAKTNSAAILARAAIGQIAAALDSGAPYSAAVKDLSGVELPAVLTDNAAAGLPTVQRLQAEFPDAARAALDAALRANMGASWTDRVGNFLRAQTGARALTPREGNDPDAVLSRAEAATAKGDIATALKEIAALPPEGLAAMADWQAKAQLRLDGEAAVQALLAKAG